MLIQIEIPIYMFMLMLTFSPILLIANFCLYSSSSTVRGSYDGTRSLWSDPSFEARFAYRKSSIHSFTHTLIHSFLVLCVLGSQWENSLSLPLRLHTLQICLCWLLVAACPFCLPTLLLKCFLLGTWTSFLCKKFSSTQTFWSIKPEQNNLPSQTRS